MKPCGGERGRPLAGLEGRLILGTWETSWGMEFPISIKVVWNCANSITIAISS